MARPRHLPALALAPAAVMAVALLLAACSGSGSGPDRAAAGADEVPTTVDGSSTTSSTIDAQSSTTSSTVAASTTSTSAPATSTSTTTSGSSTTTTSVPEPIEPAAAVASCASSVTMGPLEMKAVESSTCLARRGLEWTTDRPVTVGGIDFRPVAPGAVIVFDPFNARVASTGYEAYGSVLGAPLLLASGPIDWSFQYTPAQNGPIGSSMPVQADVVDLTTVARLPGLADVRSYPRQPINGFVDYSVVTDESVVRLAGRFASLTTAEVVFPLEAIGLREIPEFSVSVPSVAVQELAGLDVTGAFSLQPVSRDGRLGMRVATSLSLPDWLSGYRGEFAAFFPVNGDVEIDRLLVDIKLIDLEVVRFTNVYLFYDKPTDTWSGRVSVLLGPGADALGLDGRMSIVDGELQSVGVTLTGLPIRIGEVASINALGGVLTIEPLGVRALGTLGLGPNVPTVGNVAVADGELVIDEDELSLTGSVTVGSIKIRDYVVKGLRVADARVAYYWDGLASISGSAQFFLDDAQTWGIRAGVRGGATGDALSLGGDAQIRLGPFVSLNGTAAISSRGWIGCATVRGLWFTETRVGVSYDWGQPAARIRGDDCNTETYQLPLRPSGTAQSGRNAAAGDEERVIVVPDGQRMVTFAIGGAGATVLGPDGTRIVVTGAEQSTESDPVDPRWMVVRQPGDTTAYVLVGRPAAGSWTVLTSEATASVDVSAVSPDSRPLEAPTETLRPTSEPQPLVARMSVELEPTGGGGSGASWPLVLVVLGALVLILGVVLVAERRRSDR